MILRGWKNNNKNFSGVVVLADKEKNAKQKIQLNFAQT